MFSVPNLYFRFTMLYLALLTVLANTYASPVPITQLSPNQLFYYPNQQYVKTPVQHPYIQYTLPAAKSFQRYGYLILNHK